MFYIYLASRSQRRQILLKQLGLPFRVLDVQVDEHRLGGEPPRAYVHRLALEKARAGLCARQGGDDYLVIAADTAVVIDDKVLGKPEDSDQALAMLGRLSGRCHQVYTAVALAGGIELAALSVSRVEFRPLNEAEQRAYVRSEEPFGKAGGYAVQGFAGAFIRRIEGSYSGIMGLPLYETAQLLKQAGIDVAPPPLA
ncbi:MAG: Maf family protein [Gammaproteobacteria bacterium]